MAFKFDLKSRSFFYIVLFVCCVLLLLSQAFKKDKNYENMPPPKDLLPKIISKYSPISLGADLSNLTYDEKSALKQLVLLGKLIDRYV
jgi:hypothetical protein